MFDPLKDHLSETKICAVSVVPVPNIAFTRLFGSDPSLKSILDIVAT